MSAHYLNQRFLSLFYNSFVNFTIVLSVVSMIIIIVVIIIVVFLLFFLNQLCYFPRLTFSFDFNHTSPLFWSMMSHNNAPHLRLLKKKKNCLILSFQFIIIIFSSNNSFSAPLVFIAFCQL